MVMFFTSCVLVLYGLIPGAWSASYPSYQYARCANGTLPTPTYGSANILFTACAEQLITAPVSKVYNALLDFRKYHTWNSFVIDVSVPPNVNGPADVYVGMQMNFTSQGLIPLVNTPSTELVTVLAPSAGPGFAFLAWRSNDAATGGKLPPAEHPTSLVDQGNGVTRYVSWETYYLPGALMVAALAPNLQKEFTQQGKDLKAYVQSLP